MMRLTFAAGHAVAASAAADPDYDDRETFTGVLVPWDTPGDTSAGRVTVPRGSIALPDDPRRVKLTAEHDRSAPVGVFTALTETDAGLLGTFQYGRSPAARAARLDMLDGIRDGLSVDLVDVTTDRDGRLVAARLVAAGQVTVPAYDDARGIAAAMNDDPEVEVPAMPDDTMTADAAPAAAAPAAAARPVRTRPVSPARELAARLVAARHDSGDSGVMSTMSAALADVTPGGNGAGNDSAGLAIAAVGELWNGRGYEDRYSVLVTAQSLTGALIQGWRWTVPPAVAPYAGNKADITSNAATLAFVSEKPQRLAGGHDLDRIYLDLGDADVIASYWRELTKSCAEQLDAARLAAAIAAAGTAGTATDPAGAILAGLVAVPTATYAAVAQDLWVDEMSKPVSELPALFTTGSIFGNDGPPVAVFPAPGLTGQVLVGDRSAIDFYTTQPPIRVEGVVVAKGGVDAGLFAYYGDLVTSPGDVKLYTVGAPVAAAAGTSKGSK